jgi:hypothetical protein
MAHTTRAALSLYERYDVSGHLLLADFVLGLFAAMKMEVIRSSETSVQICIT